MNKINHRSVAVSRRPRFKAFFEKISLITFSAGARRVWRKLYRMCSLRSSCLTRVEFGPSRSSLFYGFKIYPPSLPGFVSMYRKFVNRLYHYSSVLLCTFARISKYIKEKELINFFLLPCFDSEGKSRKHKQKQTKVT